MGEKLQTTNLYLISKLGCIWGLVEGGVLILKQSLQFTNFIKWKDFEAKENILTRFWSFSVKCWRILSLFFKKIFHVFSLMHDIKQF